MTDNRQPETAPPRWRFGLRGLLGFAALTPFVFAIAVHWIGSEPTPVAAAPDRPAIAFQQYLVDLGKTPPAPRVGARFRFTNRGKNTVHIKQLKPSCGCMAPRLEKRDFAPGESGEIILPVETANEAAGPHEYTVTVLYDDPQPRETRLTFRVDLPVKRITVSPRSLAFSQYGTRSTTYDIYVTDYPKSGLKITSAECKSPYVTVKVGKPDFDEYGHPRHRVTITVAGTVAPGRHRALVVINTDHLRYNRLRVPLLIQGPKSRTVGPQTAKRQTAEPTKR